MKPNTLLCAAVFAVSGAMPTMAEPVAITSVLSPVETMRMGFEDGTRHFVLIEQRQGTVEGEGLFSGAQINEFGWHDIVPGQSGDPLGYIELTTPNGDIAYIQWHARAVFREGVQGPPMVHGLWELMSGTGAFTTMRGLGTLQIGPGNGPNGGAGLPERRYTLQGELSARM